MWLFSRNRRTSNLLIALVAIAIAAYAVNSYLDSRADLVDQLNSRLKQLDEAHPLLQREVELKQFMSGPNAPTTAEPSAIQTRLLHLVGDWESKTAANDPSFQRVAVVQQHGFTRLNFQISASGNLATVAGLLFRVESSPVPLRVDGIQLRSPRDGGGDQLEMHINVSTLCRRGQ